MDNRYVIDIFNQLLNGKNIIIGKARQTGKSSITALDDWRKLLDKYQRSQNRKEKIKRVFNI